MMGNKPDFSSHLALDDRSSITVIMGAKVYHDGRPSGALIRRVTAAINSSGKRDSSMFLVTGGTGESGYSEALTMKKMLMEAGILEEQIIPENESHDTLSSVLKCSKILKDIAFAGHVEVCSDIYHLPRCRWLFYLAGIRTRAIAAKSGLQANGPLKWVYYYAREAAAIVWDTILMLIHLLRK